MDNRDALPNPERKSSLRDILTQTRATEEPPTAPHPRPQPDQAVAAPRTEFRIPRVERRKAKTYDAPESAVVWEQVSRQPYDLSYACLLIPRFSSHYLIGDIAENLREWMRQICVSFSWRLDNIFIRPEYMQWILYVPAATPPSRCIRAIREETSRRIFEDFPHIRRENISKDFWAPGYLVLVGPTPHSRDMINEYIRLTRQHQGIQPRSTE
jgi:putative transposase